MDFKSIVIYLPKRLGRFASAATDDGMSRGRKHRSNLVKRAKAVN
jgi:hypothetical protein